MSLTNAYIFGCSHAAGSEMTQAEGIKYSFPCLLAKYLGYNNIFNYSVPGGSNDAIFRILFQKIDQISEKDIVIVCWTGLNRTEIFNSTTQSWQIINQSLANNNYSKAWLINHGEDNFGRLNKIKNILAFNSLTKKKNVKTINIDSFWPVWDIDLTDIFLVQENFWDWSLSKNYAKTANGHFDFDAHQDFANFLLKNTNELH